MSDTITTVIGSLCTRMGWATDSAHKVVALEALNDSEKWIPQQGSFLYLSKRSTLAINSAASSANAPADFDYGKAASLVGDAGPLEYKQLGEFDAVGLKTGGNVVRSTLPGYWTFAFSGTQATIFVKPANTSGGNLTLTFTYQRTVVPLVDDSSSKSLLPEGYERTILLDRGEWYLKKLLGIPMTPRFLSELDTSLKAFFNAQLTSKPEAQTADEIVAAKQYERQLKPGA